VRIAQGQSNHRIGTALGISERTVERHVAKIFAKLAVHSRARIAAWAVECRLMREAP
jgi:DNA-binding NarL/FixJ family response regulator